MFGAQGYVDIALGFYQFLALALVVAWLGTPDLRLLVLAGVLAGLALGIKHQGLSTLAVAVPLIVAGGLYRRQGIGPVLRDAALFVALALALVAPWYLRAYHYAGNPLWPLANGLFGGLRYGAPPVVLSGNTDPAAGLARSLVPSWEWLAGHWESMSPWSWALLRQGAQKWTGIYFIALLPGVVLLRRRSAALLVALCGLYYVVLVRFLHMNPRYGVALLGVAAVLAGGVAASLAASRVRAVRWLFGVGFGLTMVLNACWVANFNLPLLRVALGLESRAQFLRRSESGYAIMETANQSLPKDARVLLQGIVRGFYCDRDYLWDHPYQSVLDYSGMASPEALRARLRELGVTHVIRMIRIPPGRVSLGYPQYFLDEFHEAFRARYLRLQARTAGYVLFEVDHDR